MIGTKLGSVYY